MGVEHPPEAVVSVATVLDDVIKFVLSASLDGLPLLISRENSACMQRLKNVITIEKEKRIADVKEDEGRFQGLRVSGLQS